MTQDNKYWYLRNHKLFDQLSSKEIENLCIVSNMKNAEKNDVIYFSESEIIRQERKFLQQKPRAREF